MPRPRAEKPTYSLAKRAGGRWYIQWWQNGRTERVSARTTNRAEARRFLASFVAAQGTPAPPDQPTIGDILTGYLADRKGRVAAYDTLEVCAAALRRHLADLIPDHLTRERARSYATARRKEGYMVGPPDKRRKKPLSNGTIIREIVTLRAALKWAVEEKWIAEAPAVEAPSSPPSRDRWLTREEAERLLEACQAPHVRLFVALALNTGARAGALLELRWNQISDNAIQLGEPRGRKRRARVPINDDLREELDKAAEIRTSDWVIERTGKPVGSIKTGFRAAARRAKLEDVSPHVLRHTAATWMVQENVPLSKVAAYLGNTEAMIEKVYGHHSPTWLRQASEALGRRVSKVTEAVSPSETS